MLSIKQNSDLTNYYCLDVASKVISSNANLNSYTTPGQYKTESASVSATISNTPYKSSGFKLMVEFLSNSSHIMQTLKAVNSPYYYYRTGTKSGTTWTWNTWNQVITSSDSQSGDVSLGACAANSISDFNVKFPQPFSSIPHVCVTLRSSSTSEKYGDLTAYVANITTTGFTFRVANASTTQMTPGGTWIAML